MDGLRSRHHDGLDSNRVDALSAFGTYRRKSQSHSSRHIERCSGNDGGRAGWCGAPLSPWLLVSPSSCSSSAVGSCCPYGGSTRPCFLGHPRRRDGRSRRHRSCGGQPRRWNPHRHRRHHPKVRPFCHRGFNPCWLTHPYVDTDADPLKFSGDEQEAVFSFERRLGDAGVVAPGLEHALFWPEGDFAPSRGLRAKQDTSLGQVLVELPRGQAICLDEGEGTPFPQWYVARREGGRKRRGASLSFDKISHAHSAYPFNPTSTNHRVPQKQWKKLPWYAQLGLKLVYERKVATSPLKASYAQLLPPPGALPTPFHWADADLEALRAAYPALAQRVDRQRAAWEALYDVLGKTRAVREDMDEATFVWAMESVLSRSFKGTFGTGLRSLGPSLLLMGAFAAVYKVDQETIQLVTYALEEYPFLAAVPAALTLLPLLLCV